MSAQSARGFFITGTDTGVGKTYAACLLIDALKKHGLRVAAMKPVAAGVEADGVNEDVRLLMAAANVQAPLQLVNAGRLIAYIDNSWDKQKSLRANIVRFVPQLQKRAAENNEILVELLKSIGSSRWMFKKGRS